MAYGLCDVPQCEEPTYMGWRPLTEKRGHQVCETHWNAHKAGRFSLYDAFGFEVPPTAKRIVKLKDYCSCGNERQPGHEFCQTCIVERKRQQRKESYHRKKTEPAQTLKRNILICRNEDCQNERQPNHRYCNLCAVQQRRKLDKIRKRKIRSIKTG